MNTRDENWTKFGDQQHSNTTQIETHGRGAPVKPVRAREERHIADSYFKVLSRMVKRAIRDCGSAKEKRRREAAAWIFSNSTEDWSLRWVLRAMQARGGTTRRIEDVRRDAKKEWEGATDKPVSSISGQTTDRG